MGAASCGCISACSALPAAASTASVAVSVVGAVVGWVCSCASTWGWSCGVLAPVPIAVPSPCDDGAWLIASGAVDAVVAGAGVLSSPAAGVATESVGVLPRVVLAPDVGSETCAICGGMADATAGAGSLGAIVPSPPLTLRLAAGVGTAGALWMLCTGASTIAASSEIRSSACTSCSSGKVANASARTHLRILTPTAVDEDASDVPEGTTHSCRHLLPHATHPKHHTRQHCRQIWETSARENLRNGLGRLPAHLVLDVGHESASESRHVNAATSEEKQVRGVVVLDGKHAESRIHPRCSSAPLHISNSGFRGFRHSTISVHSNMRGRLRLRFG